jgi:hypothetical protein
MTLAASPRRPLRLATVRPPWSAGPDRLGLALAIPVGAWFSMFVPLKANGPPLRDPSGLPTLGVCPPYAWLRA